MPRRTTTKKTTDKQQYFRIGEVAERVGVKPYVLRYWESEFQWLSPEKSRQKQRLYSRQDLNLVELIARLLHKERYTIQGARKVIGDLKGNWDGGLAALDEGLAPGARTVKGDATEKPAKDLEKRLNAAEKDLQKKTRSLKDLKAAHSDLTRELVHERQRVARLLEEMQGVQTERDRLANELKERPKSDPEFFAVLKTELEDLASVGESDTAAGPALQSAE